MTGPPEFNKIIFYSAIAHAALLLFLVVDAIFFPGNDLVVQHAIRVDFIGRPDKIPLAPPVVAPPGEQPSAEKLAAEKPAPKKEAPLPPPKKIPEVNKKKSAPDLRQKQNQALDKLKELSAIEQIEQQVKTEKQKPFKYKGAEISSGKDLRGISKLQAEAYLDDVDKHIRQNWALPEWLARQKFQARVKIRFDEKGQLLSQEITQSSGIEAVDESILATVQKSLPLPPPPEKFVRLLKTEGITLSFPE